MTATRHRPERQGAATPPPAWLVLSGLALAAIVLLLVGNFVLWAGRPDPASAPTFSLGGAAAYGEIGPPHLDSSDVIQRVAADSGPDFTITDVSVVGSATSGGRSVDLALFRTIDNDGATLSCMATLDQRTTGWTCGPEASGVQVSWGETASEAATPGGSGLERSVTVFDGPPKAVSMYVMLDTGSYVGADVRDGASHVVWPGDLGGVDQLVLIDVDGTVIHDQRLG